MFYLRLISKPVLPYMSAFAGPVLYICIKSLDHFLRSSDKQYWYMHWKMSTLFTTKTSMKISLIRTSGFAKLNRTEGNFTQAIVTISAKNHHSAQKLWVFLSTDSDEIFYYLVRFFQLKIASQSRHTFKSMGNNI